MAELKPCPFCGGKAIIYGFLKGVYVECEKCKACTEMDIKSFMSNGQKRVVKAWNKGRIYKKEDNNESGAEESKDNYLGFSSKQWHEENVKLKEELEKALADCMIELDYWKTRERWISVKDRLPDTSCSVLVAFDDDYIAIVGYCGDWGSWVDGDEPIYWMPLPEPPKEGISNESNT